LEQIDISARKAIRVGKGSLLFYIRIDQLRPLRDTGELKRAEGLAIAAGRFLAKMASRTALLRRLHEDAFILLCSETTTASALDYALRLCTATADHIFTVTGETHTLTLSIGVDVIGPEFTSAETCLDHCINVISQLTSATGGNGARIYEPVTSRGLCQLRDEDIARLGRSLLDRELWNLTFQPMVALHGAKHECYEVLARPSRDMPANELPDNFIGRVFATAFAAEIDRWATLEASRHLIKKFKDYNKLQLFLNLSSMTWTDEKFLPWLKNVIAAVGLTPSNLVFQLAEADVSRDLNRALGFIDQIKAMQGLVVLSEFGLANPPLALLGKLPLDFIRLNKQLVDRSSKNDVGKDELKQLLNSLKAQDQGIIVPFIGSPAMIPTLWQHGVSYIQGDYIQPPTERMDYDFNDN
jgi:EAL domain-containing protein (putative c-di-GMP-specific phosphodiesterase class I)/GGDEF domain-containing protein